MTSKLAMQIQKPSDLEHLREYLHDAVFEAKNVIWSPDQDRATMRFWREADELPSRPLSRFLPFIRTRSFRRTECVVEWRFVRKVVSLERDRLDFHCVTDVRASVLESFIRIEFITEGAMKLSVLVDELDARIYDTGIVTENEFGFRTLSLSSFGRVRKRRGEFDSERG